MEINIEQVCAIAGDNLSDGGARRRSLSSRRQWLRRRGLDPVGTAVRMVKQGSRTIRCASVTWDEDAVRAELARVVPKGLAAATDETKQAVTESSWSRSAKRPRNSVA